MNRGGGGGRRGGGGGGGGAPLSAPCSRFQRSGLYWGKPTRAHFFVPNISTASRAVCQLPSPLNPFLFSTKLLGAGFWSSALAARRELSLPSAFILRRSAAPC